MTTRIEDFGQHIPGARKDLLGAAVISAALDGELPRRLTEAWPAPPWEKIIEDGDGSDDTLERFSLIRALRDHLRSRGGWQSEMWDYRPGGGRNGVLEVAVKLIENRCTTEQALGRLSGTRSKSTIEQIRNLATLYRHAGHQRDLGRLRCFTEKGYYRIGTPAKGHRHLYRIIVTADTLRQAAEKLPAVLDRLAAKKAEEKGAEPDRDRYSIRSEQPGGYGDRIYGIWRKHAGRWIRVYRCTATKKVPAINEAREQIENHQDELDAWFDRWRTLPNERNPTNTPRMPPAVAGTDDPNEFSDRFGFRGVQFGNWVSGERRRADLHDTSQGLEDLAVVLGWPARALSLGGRLGLAFGARGHGGRQGTKAHYEPDQRVIAISKPKGPGSLAHEWFHALDHESGRLNPKQGTGATFATETMPTRDRSTPAGRLAHAMSAYGRLLNTLGLRLRSRKLDTRRPKSKPYWSTTREMAARAFEGWIRWRLERSGIRNDYLVNIGSKTRWEAPEDLNLADPYPTMEELIGIDAALSEVTDAGRAFLPEWAARRPEPAAETPEQPSNSARARLAALRRR